MSNNFSLLGLESLSFSDLNQVQRERIFLDLRFTSAMFSLLMLVFSFINFFFLKHFFDFKITVLVSIFISSFTYNIYRLILINSFSSKLPYNNSLRSKQVSYDTVSNTKQSNRIGNFVKYLFLGVLGFYFAFELVFQLLRFTNNTVYEKLCQNATIIDSYSYLTDHLNVLNSCIFIFGVFFLLFPQIVIDTMKNKNDVKTEQLKKYVTICELDTVSTKQKIENIKENWINSKMNLCIDKQINSPTFVERNTFHNLQEELIKF